MLKSIIKKIVSIPSSIVNIFLIHYYGIDVAPNVVITGTLSVSGKHHTISIGKGTTIHSGKKDIPIGYPNPCSFWTFGNGKIVIGQNCGISNTTFCSASSIKLGDNVLIGGGVKIYDTDFHSLNYTERRNIDRDNNRRSDPVTINDDAFIGAGSIILKGSTIGKHSIIGAGSVVTGSVPENEIWAGNPARFIKKIGE